MLRKALLDKGRAGGAGFNDQAALSVTTIRRLGEQKELDDKEQRVYVGWLQWKLGVLPPGERRSVVSLVDDLADGVALCQLAQILTGQKLRFNTSVTLAPQMLDNCSVALNALAQLGVTGVDPRAFVNKDTRTVLGFLWRLVEMEAASHEKWTKPSMEIYDWVRDYVRSYPGVPKEVSKKSFCDGRLLSFMLHHAIPEAVDVTAVEMQQPRDRLVDAIRGAKAQLGVPPLITAEAAADLDSSEHALLTYLFAFRSCVRKQQEGAGTGVRRRSSSGIEAAISGVGGPGAIGRRRASSSAGIEAAVAGFSPGVRRRSSSGLEDTISAGPSLRLSDKLVVVPDKKKADKGKFGTLRSTPSNNKAGLERFPAGPEHQGVNCPTCEEPLSGRGLLVRVLPERIVYHGDCFVCSTCKGKFENYYWPYQSVPYCLTHYLAACGMTCSACKRPIKENAVIVHGRKLHSACYVCSAAGCAKEFTDSYNLFDGKPYCDEHYKVLAGITCSACGLGIDEQAIKALGGLFHKACFSCFRCSTKILSDGQKPIPFFAMDGSPICVPCHESLLEFAPNECGACGKEIRDEHCVSAMNKRWCSTCFKCTKCNQALKGGFFNVGGLPYDEQCAREL